MQTIFKYISQHGAWAFLFMAAISTSLLGPLNQFSFLYTAALLVLPLNISALRKITNINFLIIFNIQILEFLHCFIHRVGYSSLI